MKTNSSNQTCRVARLKRAFGLCMMASLISPVGFGVIGTEFSSWIVSSGIVQATEVAGEPTGSTLADALLVARLEDEKLVDGWIRLFDGVTLFGWENAGTGNWRVENGALWADQGEDSLLCTKVDFANFELTVEFWADAETNSGVFARTITKPVDISKDCLEINVASDSNPFPTGSIVYRAKRPEGVESPVLGDWNRLRILCEGKKTKVWLNDQLTADYDDPNELGKGRIGLQYRAGKIGYRNILLRPIGDTLIPGSPEAFEEGVKVETKWTNNGALEIVGGRGHVETKAKLGSGFIQFQASTLADNVNSGLFFRCIPGEDMNGYECQLHHGFKETRNVPVDSGTGAIFRRQPARAVLSDEGKSAYVTIVADGPTIATWVQGVQVVDFIDTRKPDANPRRGLRVEPGTIMLQGHDPECKVRFEGLRVGSYE